jgi:predicted acyltransferase
MPTTVAARGPRGQQSDERLPRRIVSIDVVRGLAIAGMLLVNNPGNPAATPSPLMHSAWNGFTFADSIYPLFLFAIGLSMPFSMRGSRFRRVVTRVVVLFVIGCILGSIKRGELYVGPGVLQRIAFAYLIAWLILRMPERVQLATCIAILVSVAAAFELFHPSQVFAGSWEPGTNLAAFVDERLLGHFSTEGIVGTVVASVNVVGGAFLGRLLQRTSPRQALLDIWMWATACLTLGLLASFAIPINKPLWTPTYAVFAQGICCAYLAIACWLTDVRGVRRGIKPLQVLGANPIAIYVLSTAAGDLLLDRWREPIFSFFQGWTGPTAATLIYSVAVAALWWAVAAWLYRRRILVRI